MIRLSLSNSRLWLCSRAFVSLTSVGGPARSVYATRRNAPWIMEPSQSTFVPWNNKPIMRSASTVKANSTTPKKSDRGGFIRSWMARKTRLIKSDLGSLKDKDWKDAVEAINTMRTHPDFDSSERRHRDMFAILDRLSKEMEHEQSQSLKGTKNKKVFKLPRGLLKEVMTSWKEYAFSLMPKEVRDYSVERQIQAKKCLNIFAKMGPLAPSFVIKKLDRYDKVGMFKANSHIYEIVFRVMSFDPEKGALLADELFSRLRATSLFDPSSSKYPTAKMAYQRTIETWSHSCLPDAPNRAEAYLADIKALFAESKRKEMKPGTDTYCAVMEAHSRSSEKEVAFRRIKELYCEMKEECDDVGLKAITRVCQAVANCRHRESVDFVLNELDEVLQVINKASKEAALQLPHLFNITMTVCSREARADEIEELLQSQESWAERLNNPSLKPNAHSYSNLIWAHTRRGESDKAEAVLDRIMKSGIELNAGLWTGLLIAWAGSGEQNASTMISKTIKQLEQTNPEWVNTRTYNALLLCYCREGSVSAAKSAERLLLRMQDEAEKLPKPDRGTYLSAIESWCSAGRPDKAELLLKEFCTQGLVEEGLIDTQHFGIVMEAWTHSGDRMAVDRVSDIFSLLQRQNLAPDVISYTSLLSCWAKSKKRDRWNKMRKIYDEMKDQWRNGDEFARPDITTFNVLLHGLLNVSFNDMAFQTSLILHDMKEQGIIPNIFIYNTLMAGLAKIHQPEEVEGIFNHMMKDFSEGNNDAKPNARAFTTRLQAWSQAGNPQMTTKSLNDWIEGCESGLIKDEQPGTQAFNAVLVAWLHSGESDDAKKAEMGLRQMLKVAEAGLFDCRPDKYSFRIVLTAYTKTRSPDAGKKSYNLLRQMDSSNVDSTPWAYSLVMKALSQSFGSSCENQARRIIKEILEKPYAFWEEDEDSPIQSINLMKSSIRSSNFNSKRRMLEQLDGLEFRVKSRLSVKNEYFSSD